MTKKEKQFITGILSIKKSKLEKLNLKQNIEKGEKNMEKSSFNKSTKSVDTIDESTAKFIESEEFLKSNVLQLNSMDNMLRVFFKKIRNIEDKLKENKRFIEKKDYISMKDDILEFKNNIKKSKEKLKKTLKRYKKIKKAKDAISVLSFLSDYKRIFTELEDKMNNSESMFDETLNKINNNLNKHIKNDNE